MGNCLVTKLKGTVDSELRRLGEMYVWFKKQDTTPTLGSREMVYSLIDECDFEIIGDGYFTDNTLTNNLGKKLHFAAGDMRIVVSNNDVKVAVLNKFAVKGILSGFWYDSGVNGSYKKLDFEEFRWCVNLKTISITNSPSKGDLSDLAKLSLISLSSEGNSSVGGDISNLAHNTDMNYLAISSKGFYGNIESLAPLTKLETLHVASDYLSGNINTATKNMNSLTSVLFSGDVTGDLAILPDSVRVFYGYSKNELNWSSRPTTANIISIFYNTRISDIDKMLQDQSKCVVPSAGSKSISAIGTRTSASDDAVAALQEKGYTVSITAAS